VYHLAGNTENRSDQALPGADYEVTVGATVHLLESLRRSAATPTFVLVSSQLVYASTAGTPAITEGGTLGPQSLFGAGKMAAEAFTHAYAHEFGFDAVCCRLGNIIGPDFGRGIVHDFIERVRKDPTRLTVLGHGRQTRSYLHVDDCVRALRVTASSAGAQGRVSVYNVANLDQVSALDVAAIVRAECPDGDPEIEISQGPSGWRGDVGSLIVRPDRLSALGWVPSMGSADSVRRVVREAFQASVPAVRATER
jgi:UDP-glucose 4-epimerase